MTVLGKFPYFMPAWACMARERSWRGGVCTVDWNGDPSMPVGKTYAAGIAAQYEKVVTTYHLTRLDLDTEEDSLNNYAGIDRRNKAIALVEQWAQRTNRTVRQRGAPPVDRRPTERQTKARG
jgi:hypothetical protein